MDRIGGNRQQGMSTPILTLAIMTITCALIILPNLGSVHAQGTWQTLVKNAGIASMHTAVTHYSTAILLDRTNIGKSQIALPNGKCRDTTYDRILKHDCTAHSVMFDPATNKVRALTVLTDTWCSSGQFFADGTMVQTGGDFEGLRKIRRLKPCAGDGNCDWVEDATNTLTDGRWYATNQLLPGGTRQIVVGGRTYNTYEFVPKRATGEGSFNLALLKTTTDTQGDNEYPYVHLLPTGKLFIFANRDSIVFDYDANKVVKTLPTIPGEPRNYPSAGSSVMLPLDQANGFSVVEVLVCGGAHAGAFRNTAAQYAASQTCGRITPLAAKPAWAMETMPVRRTMGDMVIMPTGDVLIINGAQNGCQGWGKASNAVLTPVSYATNNAAARFKTLTAGTVPRVYHSTANLLPDGRILLAGSNSHQYYTYTGAFPTELRVEAYSPAYLAASSNNLRPTITKSPGTINYGKAFAITFKVTKRQGTFEVNMLSAPFVTHSYAMGQRLLKLKVTTPVATGGGYYTVTVTAPTNDVIAPQSYYMLFPIQNGIPGTSAWAQIK